MKGFDLILERIKADPFKATLRFRYLALVADLPDAMEKANEVLKLAEFYKLDFPREALQTAYLVCRYDPKNVKAVEIIIDILESQKRLPQASFMREFKAKIESQKNVSSNQFFGDMSRSGLFDPGAVDESLTFNPGEEFLADQLSGEFSNANESKLISLLSIDKGVKEKSLNSSSSTFEITPIDQTGPRQTQEPHLAANLLAKKTSNEFAPLAQKPQGPSLDSPSTAFVNSPLPSSELVAPFAPPTSLAPPASLAPPSSLTPPTSLTPPASLMPAANMQSIPSGSHDEEVRDLPDSQNLSISFGASLDLTLESQDSTFGEALADENYSGPKIPTEEFSGDTSWDVKESNVENTVFPYVEKLDVASTEISFSNHNEVAEKASDFEDSGQVQTQLYSPRLDLMQVEEVEDKTFLSHHSPERKWALESSLKGNETVIARGHQVYESSQEEVGNGEGEDRLGRGKITFASSAESTANHSLAESKKPGFVASKNLRDQPFSNEVEQSLGREFDSSSVAAESRNMDQAFAAQSAAWWQQALESHSKKTALGRLEMDPESFSFFLLENLREHKSPYEVIRRSLTTEQKHRLFSYFLNISTPGMELLKIDVFMAVGAGLEAVQLIREYAEQGELELSSLVQRARVLWQVLGWEPFIWRGHEGREDFKRILFQRPSQRPSLELL